jgi:hypothetical protein
MNFLVQSKLSPSDRPSGGQRGLHHVKAITSDPKNVKIESQPGVFIKMKAKQLNLFRFFTSFPVKN